MAVRLALGAAAPPARAAAGDRERAARARRGQRWASSSSGSCCASFESAVPDLHLAIDWRSRHVLGGLALAAGVLFGLSPALHATRLALSDVLKDAAGTMAPSRSRLPAALVVAQIALTQPALLAMGALFLQMVESVREMPRAVQADRIIDARFNTNPRYGAMDGQREQALARLQARFEALPGVVAVVPQENADD